MSQPKPLQQHDAPIEAFRFAAQFTTGDAKDGNSAKDGAVPFTCLARTAEPVPHWYWGRRCLHDFAGMEAAEVLPVDWNHETDEVLGFINARTVTPDGLQLTGALTPFGEHDRASEVIHKSAKGVPYQASIFFDPFALIVEDVPAGFKTDVNGQTIDGPVTIFRKWKLNGLAICPYGVDAGTNVRFSRALSGQTAAITRFTTEVPVTDPTPAPAPVTTPDANPKPTNPEPQKEPVKDVEKDEQQRTTTPPVQPPTQLSRKQQSDAFIKAFGEQHGPVLFSRHDRIEDAHIEYAQILRKENDELRKENAKFAAGPRGEQPASFSGAPDAKDTVPTKFANLPANIARLAAGIKLPGR